MKRLLFLYLFGYCSFILSCGFSRLPQKILIESRWTNLAEQKANQLDSLFRDTVIVSLRAKNPGIKICNSFGLSHIQYGDVQKDSVNNILSLGFTYGKNNIQLPEGDGMPHSPCYEQFTNVLYNPKNQDYILLNVSDLNEIDKRYLLKKFLNRNFISIADKETMFSYLYQCYSERYTFLSSFCTPNYFTNLKEVQKIPINTNPKFGMTEKDVQYLKIKMAEAISRYQKDIQYFYCGAMTNLEPNIGKWSLYFFVVDERKPIEYEVYVFQTPKNKCYMW